MTANIIEVCIYPFAHDEEEGLVNAEDYGLDPEGWNVHSFDGENEFDEEEFSDFETAVEYAEEIAKKYGVQIDHRY